VPAGYEYSLSASGPWQPSNVFFPINTAGNYTVYIKQTAVTSNPCVFSVPNIQIRKRNFSVTPIVVQPLCHGGKGTVALQINDVRPQYFVTVKQGGVIIESRGPDATGGFQFNNVNPGTYDYTVTTDDGCTTNLSVTIFEPATITASSALTKPLTCTDGEITVTTIGGTPPYNYFVNSTTVFQGTPQIAVTNPLPPGGVYTIKVVDSNNCEATTSITVTDNPIPEYTVSSTDIKCYGSNSGEIKFNVTNANGYTLSYSINNGTTYLPAATFTNLVAGTYNTIVRYALGTSICFDTMKVVTLSQPPTALTASAGVSELAGCGPAKEGKIRITNPQGGTPFPAPNLFVYSFDNQATWITANDAYKAPGTYTVYIKDANGCIFAMPGIIIDPEPVAPSISVNTPVDFNCDGTATSTVTINNPGPASYSYDYYLDTVKNTNVPSNVFLNVPVGTHAIRVQYLLTFVPTFSNLLKEDFGSGAPTTTTGIAAAYCFNDLRISPTYLCGTRSIEDNQYSVTNDFWRSDDPSGTNAGAWYHFKDHTTNGADPKGRFLLVNIGSAAGPNGVLYSKPIVDVIPNQPVKVDFAVANLLKNGINGAAPDILVQLVDVAGTVVAQQNSGKIAELSNDPNRNKWVTISLTLNPGNNTNLKFVVRSGSVLYNGNDVVIDDISVYQLPKSCITTKDFTIVVPSGKAFTASIAGYKNVKCNGANGGEITIAAQNFDAVKGFQYSTDNGVTWSTSILTSPYVITNLFPKTYTVLIRPVASTVVACTKSFNVTITEPAAVTASASITKVASCTSGATITAVGGGGTPAFQYELRQSDGITVVTAFNNNPVFTNVSAGSYLVYVRDANGCINTTAIVVAPPPTLTASLDAATDYCYTTANPATLIVTVTGGVGPFTYKLNTNAPQNSNTFNNIAPGTHTILVTDSNNCTATISGIIIEPQLTITATLAQDLTCLVDASINANVTGGYGLPYIYTVSYNSGVATSVTSFPYIAITAGTYVFTVTGSKGCPATSNTITITAKTTPTHTTAKTDITCTNSNDGTITVTAAGGFTNSYTYAIKLSSAATYTMQTNNKFTGLPAGTYDIKVIDSKGCESVVSNVIIANPSPIVATATATAFSCNTITNTKQSATITVTPTGGTGTYTYSYNNGGSFGPSNTLTANDNGTTQPIRIIVKDSNGCLSPMQLISLAPLNPPTISSISHTDIYCAPIIATTSTVTVTRTAGTGAGIITYEIITPMASATSNTTGVFIGLAGGITYTFKVTDANGCFAIDSHNVPVVTPIAVTATKLTDVDCFGNTTGSIRYNVSGFKSTYSYSVNGSAAVTGQTATSFILPNLGGTTTYNVVFTDETSVCTAPTSIIITQPAVPLSANFTTVNANCNVAFSQVKVTAVGGTSGYTYSFVANNALAGTYTASNLANLDPALVWDVWVKDAKGCTFKLDLVIAKDVAPSIITATGSGCLGTMGGYTITATATGGTGTLSYSINAGASYQPSNTFTIASAGTYTIRVKDANGCTADSNVIIVAPQLTLNAVLNKGITCNPVPTDAQITLTPTGGTGPFTYESKEVLGAYTPMASNVFNTALAGSYTFRVTDTATGCTAVTSTPIVTTLPINPDITSVVQTQFINCNGEETAAIAITINNTLGLAPFVFNVLNTTTGTNYGTQTSGLKAGIYTVKVTDAKGCIDTQNITIAEPNPMVISKTVIPIQCNSGTGISKGSIIIDKITDGISPLGGTGGTAPYTYYVTGINGYNQTEANATGTTSVTFNVVDFGLYQIRIVDANGCSIIENDVLVASPINSLGITIDPTVSCATGGSATIKITSTFAGVGPFHFNIYNGPGQVWVADGTNGWQGEAPSGSKETVFTLLTPGVTYTFIVYDEATKCYYFESAAIPVPSTTSLSVDNIVPKNITCTGSNDGNVSFDIKNTSASTIDYTYEVFEALTNVSKYVSGTSTNIGPSTDIYANIPVSLSVGSYYIYVKEASGPNTGCGFASANFSIKESPKLLVLTASLIKNANCTDLGVISAQAKDGTAPYTYQVTSSATFPLATDPSWVSGNTFTKTGTIAGSLYYVYAKDAYGCIKQKPVTVFKDADPTITAPLAPICYDGSTPFTITITGNVDPAIVGGATYSVNGSAFQSSPNFTFNAAGTYNLVIQDGNGCKANVDFVVYPKLNLAADLTKKLDCTVSPNATITLTATGGNTTPAPNYTYEVSSNGGVTWIPMATNVYSASSSGTYTFRVTDANNTTTCQTTTTFVLDPIPTTVFSTSETNLSCFNSGDGTITVNVTAGEGPFEYQLDLGVPQTSNEFTGLAAGTYVVTVRNARNCILPSGAITITQPLSLSASATVAPYACNASNIAQPALITVNVDSLLGVPTGTGPYKYNFDGSTTYFDANTLLITDNGSPQTILFYVMDANGCTYDNSVIVTPYQKITDLTFAGAAITCTNLTTDITVGVVGGYPITKYEIVSPIAVDNTNNPLFTALSPGTYLFKITDANGCYFDKSLTIAPVTNITVSGQLISDVTCFGAANGVAQFDVTNFAGNYNYVFGSAPLVAGINTAQLTFNNLAPGPHSLVVTDVLTGCTSTASITISQPVSVLDFTATTTNINCNNDNATITVTATGGTLNYKYSAVIAGGTPTVFSTSNLITVDTNTGANMAWDVYVTDANGCSISKPQTIVLNANPIISSAVATQCPSSTGTYDIAVTASGFSVSLQYSADGSNYQTGNVITVNAPGAYIITVKDANGCISTGSSVIILNALILTPTVTSSPTCANGDGVVAVVTSGGSGNYEYRMDAGAYGATTPFIGVASGSHSIDVRDTTTGCIVSATIDLKLATPVTGFALTTTPVTCNGGTDGTITATLATPALGVNDNPVYLYSLNGGAPQASNLFTGLAKGTYTILVTSERGCTATQNITVAEPALIVVPAPTVVEFGCISGNTGNLATITVAGVTGGSGSYLNYEFIKVGLPNIQVQFGSSQVYTEANLIGGSYIINVYDSKGCIGTTTAPIVITPYIALDRVKVVINQAITCTNPENITVSATAIGGTPASLKYTLVDSNATTGVNGAVYSQTNPTGIFTGLAVADYLITVLNPATGCSIQDVHYVNEPNTFDLTIDTVVDVTCFGGTNGSANVTLIDRVITATSPDQAGPFTYTVTGPVSSSGSFVSAGPLPITGLSVGTYTVTATLSNSPFCSISKNFTITGPSAVLAISETHTEITCVSGNNDGSISATATGGWLGGYEFQLERGATIVTLWSAVTDFTGLTAGTYTVKVRDTNGCEVFATVVLNNPTPISVTAIASTSLLSCYGDTKASISVTNTTGGQGSNYSYILNTISVTPTISSGPQTSTVFAGLGAGTYTVTAIDGWNCSQDSSPIIITQPTEIKSSLTLASSQTCLDQATLKLSASGGTGPYSYSVDSNFTIILGTFASSITFPVVSGIYHYYVKDANGCTSYVSNDIEIAPIPTLTINLDLSNAQINCFGDTTGVIVAKAEGGLGNYVYTLLDATGVAISPAPIQSSPGIFIQLSVGTYKVKVDSGDCNYTTALITINQPTLPLIAPYITTDVTCSGAANGQIVINASGGTGIIKYAISPNLDQFFDTNTFKDLSPNNYTVIVQDVLGCYITFDFKIDEPLPLKAITVTGSIVPEICSGDNDGEFSIDISGGTSPYKVSLDKQNGPFTSGVSGQTQFNFKNVTGGSHIVYILDAKGCSASWTVILPDAVSLKPVAIVDYDCLNNLPTNSVMVKIDSSVLPVDVVYALDGIAPYQASNVFANVPPGTHFISARHTNGCIQPTQNFTIIQINPLAVILNNGGLNEIVANTTGGSGAYQYTFNGESTGTNNTYIIYRTGEYIVEVVDSEGCTATDTKQFTFIDIKIPNVFTPDGDGNNDTWSPTNTRNYPDLMYHIYDRYGRKIGTYREGQFWDGKYNGLELPSGDYWYTLKLNNDKDDREFVGHFTLYR
jgi:gliding motility-associated-like protein